MVGLPETRAGRRRPRGDLRQRLSDVTKTSLSAREIVKTRERINQVIADETGQALERVAKDVDRDYWMSVEESVEYGLVGSIIKSVADLPA